MESIPFDMGPRPRISVVHLAWDEFNNNLIGGHVFRSFPLNVQFWTTWICLHVSFVLIREWKRKGKRKRNIIVLSPDVNMSRHCRHWARWPPLNKQCPSPPNSILLGLKTIFFYNSILNNGLDQFLCRWEVGKNKALSILSSESHYAWIWLVFGKACVCEWSL